MLVDLIFPDIMNIDLIGVGFWERRRHQSLEMGSRSCGLERPRILLTRRTVEVCASLSP